LLANIILKDPAVDSLSSFIGIDGTNTTLNSGRIQINLKPLAQRKLSASDVIRRLQPNLDKVEGITLFMQPVQDLTVEDRVSRTQSIQFGRCRRQGTRRTGFPASRSLRKYPSFATSPAISSMAVCS